MADAPVLGAKRKVSLDGAVFGARFHEPLVHESVRAEQAARRRGTAATKTRGMVSGGGSKPWRQKGTGRARAGSSRSPVWTGGGTVFGPQPRSYTFKVNRKERAAALRSALSLHAERGSIALLDAAAFGEPRTRQAVDLLADWEQIRPTLVVLDAEESGAALSFRNIARVAVLTPENVGVTDVVGAASLLCSEIALERLVARAARAAAGSATTTPEPSAPARKAPARKAAAKPEAADEAKTAAPAEASEADASEADVTEADVTEAATTGSAATTAETTDAAATEAEPGEPAADASGEEAED